MKRVNQADRLGGGPHGFRVLTVCLLTMIGGLTIGLLSTAVAATVTQIGWNGYAGNKVIYLTTGLASNIDPYLIPTVYAHGYANTTLYGNTIPNVLNISAGQAPNTTSTDEEFREYYVAGSNPYMVVYVPIASGAADKRSVVWGSVGYNDYGVFYQNLSLAISNSPSANTVLQVLTRYNSGVNVTGPSYGGSAVNLTTAVKNFQYDTICTFAPYVGYACGIYQTIQDWDKVSGVDMNRISDGANGFVFEHFPVKVPGDCGKLTGSCKDVFGATIYVEIHIPYAEFSSAPLISVTAANVVQYYDQWGIYWGGAQGATASTTIGSAPAVALTGTVSAGGRPLKNQAITLEETYNGVVTDYQLRTSSTGKYRFFARVGTSYVLSTSYSSMWGTGTVSDSFTTISTPDGQTRDLTIPSIYGYVKSAASGNPGIPGASVQIAPPTGTIYTIATDSTGYFGFTAVDTGPYNIYNLQEWAMDYSNGASQSVTIAGNSATRIPDVILTPIAHDFSVSAPCNLNFDTNSYGTCSVDVASRGNWTGTVTVTGVTVSPVVSGGPQASASPTSGTVPPHGLQWGFTVTVAPYGATGTFTVTVTVQGTVDGQVRTRSASFSVTITEAPPPPPPPCRQVPGCQ